MPKITAKVDAALSKRNQEVLKKASPLFDELNDSWEKIEQFFRKQGILRDVSLNIEPITDWDGHEEQAVGEVYLGIQKVKGKWRICHGHFYYQDPSQETSWNPVSECGTDLRIKLLDHVPALFEALVKSNEGYIPEIEKGVAKSHAILSELGFPE